MTLSMIKRVMIFLAMNVLIVYLMSMIEKYLPFYEIMAVVLAIILYMYSAYLVMRGLSIRYRKEFARVIIVLVLISSIVLLAELSFSFELPRLVMLPFLHYLRYGNFAAHQLVLAVGSNYEVVNYLLIYFSTQILLYSSMHIHTYYEYRSKGHKWIKN